LSRRKYESVIIADNIHIVVVEIFRGPTPAEDKVRLGFELPREIPLHRREVYDAIRRNPTDDNLPSSW